MAIARRRRDRPMEFFPLEQIVHQIICPFCRGNEDEAPPSIAAWNKDGGLLSPSDDPASWSTRIVPNKYPSLSEEEGSPHCGPYQCSTIDGMQELIIPTPRHVTSLSELSVQELEISLKASQERIGTLCEFDDIRHLMLFMNCRMDAGASLEHIHFQLMGSPLISPYMQQRMDRNDENVRNRGENLITTLLNWELEKQTRILKVTENFVMFCPFASRFSFQVWIVPTNPRLPWSSQLIDFNSELAGLCRTYVKKLEQLLENPAYNLLLNLTPKCQLPNDHWFIEIFPRVNRMAGYEIGTDIWVNPVPPETAARRWLA